MFGVTSYVPLFVQGVKGGSATSAGVVLGPFLLAWPIAATLTGKIAIQYGYRFTTVAGALFYTVGIGMVTLFNAQTELPFIVIAMVLIGTGLGLTSTSHILAVQNAVPWNLRGVVTASTQFFRTIGGTIGVAIMGTILNAQMALRFTPIFAHFASAAARLPRNGSLENVLLTPEVRSLLPHEFLSQLQVALAQSLFWVYALMFVLAAIGLASAFLFPGGRADQHAYKVAEKESASAESPSESLMHIG
jgi:MFS family permease